MLTIKSLLISVLFQVSLKTNKKECFDNNFRKLLPVKASQLLLHIEAS